MISLKQRFDSAFKSCFRQASGLPVLSKAAQKYNGQAIILFDDTSRFDIYQSKMEFLEDIDSMHVISATSGKCGAARTDGKTRRIVPFFLFIAGIVLFLFSPYPVPCVYGKTTLKVGVYNNKPTIFADEDGSVKGLFIDILEEIAASEGWELEYVTGHFADILAELKAGRIDLLPAVAYAREREPFLDYTFETVMANWAELYVPNGVEFTSLIELEGKKIGVKQGDIHFQVLRDMTQNFNISCRFLEADEYETVFEMLDAHFIDVGAVNRLFGNRNKANYRIQATPVIYNPIEMRYAVPEGKNEQVIAKIDSYLTSFKSDVNSIYYQSINRWFVVSGEESFPSWALHLLYGIAGTVLLLLGATMLLRHQVKKRTTELTLSNKQLEAQIEERKRAEDELRRYARVVEASGDAMALVDLQHRHVLYNSQYRKLLTPPGGEH